MDFTDPITQNGPLNAAPPSPPAPPAQESAQSVVDLLDVLLVIVVAIMSVIVCTFLAAIVAYARAGGQPISTKDLSHDALFVIPAQFVAYVIIVAFMVFIVDTRHYHVGFLRGIQWNMPKAGSIIPVLAAGGALAMGSQLFSVALHRWIPKTLPIDQYFKGPASGYVLAVFGVLVAPLVEELFFRGFLYPAVARFTGREIAIIITAAGFSLLHQDQLAHAWAPLAILFGVGVVLTVVRARTNSVATCVLLHMGYNLALFAVLWFATQGFRHMERAALDSFRAALLLW
ncbi:MAG TPA: type II CAAX endopeptidase family protein [Terriglobales bacterium]|nr:type II CAAX endopeptidase family protein [Terriglobales bacterium]